jgi:predicted ATP-grasp superfamily ATP-dependent carboligase
VLGLRANGYGIIRALGRCGVEVIGVYRAGEEAGRFSRYCRAYQIPSDRQSDEQVCETLVELTSAFPEKPILFVSSDKYASLLATYKDVLSPHFLFHWVSPSELDTVVDKSKIGQVCRDAGVVAPRTYFATAGGNLVQAVEGFRFPLIIKPIRSFDLAGGPRLRTLIADSPEDLLNVFEQNPGLWDTSIVQEVIEGEDDEVYQCTLVMTSEGSVAAACQVRKLQQFKPGFGHMALGRTEENPELLSRSLRLLRVLRWRGMASIEFKRDRRTGEYYFIEMNPRMPWYGGLFADAGVNLAHAAYLDLANGPGSAHAPAKQRDGLHWMRFEHCVRWLLIRRRQGRTRFWPWLRAVSKARSFAWWDRRDPLPCLAEMAYRYAYYCGRLAALIRGQAAAKSSPASLGDGIRSAAGEKP